MGESLWNEHDRAWRDPAAVVARSQDVGIDQALLRSRARGDFWRVLDELDVTLLVSREYEHLLLALCVEGGKPRMTYLPLPHPSGIAVDRDGSRVLVASTRNPNQIYDFRPARADGNPLLPVASTYYPGALYLHDLAFVGRRLHGNAVGQNAIVRFDERGGYERVWWPRCIERRGKPDVSRNYIQLNSIAAGRSLASSYFSASAAEMTARRPGQRSFPVDRRGVVFSGRTREPVVRGLTRPHSARLAEGRLWVDDSGYGELGVVDRGRFEAVARLPGWTRGLAFADGVAFVGTSRVIPRFRRYAPGLDVDKSVCGVHAVDTASGEILGSLTWPAGNQIFAVEWVPRSMSSGWPFRAGRRQNRRIRELFYSLESR
ncbi:MAG: DUF4915 domain-containing protein [Actinobacteria bacterium]|nr:DUF4915 domain-containing protein [Actinomycetota bacterium]